MNRLSCLNKKETAMTSSTLDIAGLETVYDQLATAIDAAGTEKSELLLVKLALLTANRLGDASQFAELIAAAQRDL